jgi:tetratricopeptide (TPR) repeat protein
VLHRRFADWVIALPGREEELSEIVAYHLEQACLTVRTVARPHEPPPIDAAIEMLTRAAEKAERREGIREAERFYARALGLLDAESPVGVELRLKQARMLTGLGQFGVAFEQLLSVEPQAAAWGLDAVRCGALMALARIDLHQGRGADCLQRLDEAETLAEEIGDSLLRIRASYELSQARAWFEGSAQEAVAELERALVLAEEFGDRPLRIEGHLRMGTLMFNMGRLVEADEHLERCLELSEAVGSRRDEGRARYLLGFVRFYRGGLTDAERLANAAAALLERTDDRLFQLLNTRALAKYALARGDPLLAQVQLQESLPNALAFGGWLVVEFYRYLAEAYVRQGLLAEAREAAVQARANLPGEDAYASAAVLLSEVMSAEGGDVSLEATRSRVAEAFRLLEEQHLLLDLEEARINAARSLRRLGDVLSSREHLEVAYAALQRIEAAGLLAEVERELAEADGTGDAGPVTSS